MVYDLDKTYRKILESLKDKGYTQQTSTKVLQAEIKRAFNIVQDDTTEQYIKTMEQLGYIESDGSFWELHFPGEENKTLDDQTEEDLSEIDKRVEASSED